MAAGNLSMYLGLLLSGLVDTSTAALSHIGVCCDLVFCPAIVVLMNLLSFAMIIIGSSNVHDCPTEKFIPIYLIVSGILTLVWINYAAFKVYKANQKTKSEDTSDSNHNPCLATLYRILSFFWLFWFIAGNIWIFLAYEPSYVKGEPDYCDKLTYKMAFWSIVLTYLIPNCICCLFFCGGLCFGLSGMSDLLTENQDSSSEEEESKPDDETDHTGPQTSNQGDNTTGSSIYPDLNNAHGDPKPVS